MESCPFKIGDEVIYRPTTVGRNKVVMTALGALVPGKKYKVAQIEKNLYVVVEGFENTAGGGLYYSEFAPAKEEKTDASDPAQ